jgi:hypothetical protein
MTSFFKGSGVTGFKGLMLAKFTGCIAGRAAFPGLEEGEILSSHLTPVAADVPTGPRINA